MSANESSALSFVCSEIALAFQTKRLYCIAGLTVVLLALPHLAFHVHTPYVQGQLANGTFIFAAEHAYPRLASTVSTAALGVGVVVIPVCSLLLLSPLLRIKGDFLAGLVWLLLAAGSAMLQAPAFNDFALFRHC